MSDFSGFPKETVTFFEELKANNTKEWFGRHRKDYEDYVEQPAREFVLSMGEMLRLISPGINAIPKVNKSLFRLNRDTRFSRDKRPYKTNLGIWFWEGERKRMECSGFYFHMEDGRLMLGVGIHLFSTELLQLYRDAVVDKRHGPPLRKTVHEVSKNGYVIGGKHYKKVPHGYDASHQNAEFLLYNGLTAMVEQKIPKEFYSGAIVDFAFSHFKNMQPVHEWLRKALA
ncbi:MAG: DUF2461 domain-containing protein [Pseudomonadota bacterium]